jgi:hypothetical protein
MCLSTKDRKMVTNTCPVVAVQIMNPMNGKTEKTYARLRVFHHGSVYCQEARFRDNQGRNDGDYT